MGMGGGMMGGGGGGFFSVPPQKTVQVPLTSVCLQHGKEEPRSKMTYKLIKLEEYTSDPVLQELLEMVGTGKLDSAVAQAATWNLTDKMSWEKLAAKEIENIAVPNEPYFSQAELLAAQQLVGQAQTRARERGTDKGGDETPRPKGRILEKKS
jgi:DNA-binding transcriptional LysR family regulator